MTIFPLSQIVVLSIVMTVNVKGQAAVRRGKAIRGEVKCENLLKVSLNPKKNAFLLYSTHISAQVGGSIPTPI